MTLWSSAVCATYLECSRDGVRGSSVVRQRGSAAETRPERAGMLAANVPRVLLSLIPAGARLVGRDNEGEGCYGPLLRKTAMIWDLARCLGPRIAS